MSSSKLPTHLQYRNATYYGGVQRYQRNGHGLLVLDNSQILLAQWRKNIIHGKYVYINDTLRAYGTMLDNRLDGYNILWMKMQGREGKGERTVYGMFREDKLYGKAVVVQNGMVMVSQFVNNELKEVISKAAVKDRQVYDALTQHFPKNMYTLQQFLIAFMKDAAVSIQQEQQIPRYKPTETKMGEQRFFGYEQCFNKGRRYGFILRFNQIVSIGEHLNNNLEGIGRFYGEDFIQDGIFKDGYLKGIGIKYFRQGNKYTLGEHDGRSTLEKGFGFPNREVCQIRKEFHLRSIYFYNDIVMLGITSHLTSLLGNIMMDGRPKRNQSPKFTEQYRGKSPVQRQLYKYDVEQDYIQDSSPIKDKFSEYKPVDHRANKYFTLDQEQEEFDRKRQKEKALNSSNNNYRLSRNANDRGDNEKSGNERVERGNERVDRGGNERVDRGGNERVERSGNERGGERTINSRFNNVDSKQEQLKAGSNSRSRGVTMISQNRERSGSRNNGRSGVKDTREFVRQLQQRQKSKRLDLDKIYRQAGLYRKK